MKQKIFISSVRMNDYLPQAWKGLEVVTEQSGGGHKTVVKTVVASVEKILDLIFQHR